MGSDGSQSAIRKMAQLRTVSWSYKQRGLVATVATLTPNTAAMQVFLPNGPLALLPVRDGLSNIVWSTTPAQAAELEAMRPEEFVAAVNLVNLPSSLLTRWLAFTATSDLTDLSVGIRVRVQPVWSQSVACLSLNLCEGTVPLGSGLAAVEVDWLTPAALNVRQNSCMKGLRPMKASLLQPTLRHSSVHLTLVLQALSGRPQPPSLLGGLPGRGARSARFEEAPLVTAVVGQPPKSFPLVLCHAGRYGVVGLMIVSVRCKRLCCLTWRAAWTPVCLLHV